MSAGSCWLPLLLSPAIFAQSTTVFVTGKVSDDRGQALPFANVQIVDSFEGGASNHAGRFIFATRKHGEARARATRMGYETVEHSLRLPPGDTAHVDFVLHETIINMKEAVVTASAFVTGDEGKGVTLRRLEVVTTPGAAADIFLAIKTFPGVAMVDEGSGLFVRGGDVSETVTLLDQATVVHPYKYESPTGGVFGTISPFLVSGTFFSAGGFSARYGNALSGILAMESQNLPAGSAYTFNLGLAAASLGAQIELVPNKLGVRLTGNRSFTEAMFRLNGQKDEFAVTPRGNDGNLSLIYQYSPTGRVKFFNYAESNRLGVHVDQPSFEGIYRGEENNQLHNLQWLEMWQGWLVKTSLSFNRYGAKRQLGNLSVRPRDDTYKWRFDVEKEWSPRFRFAWGGEVERMTNRFQGSVPQNENVLDPDASVYHLDEEYSAQREGAFAEIEAQLSRRWTGSAGVRADHHDLAAETTVAPRISLRYAFSRQTHLRCAWGLYHQFPQPYLFNPESGAPGLASQRAQHFILGIEHQRQNTLVRAEAYYKPYKHLIVEDFEEHYSNRGEGSARGFDFFCKYGAFLQTRLNGWLSYSFLKARRLQARDMGNLYVYEHAPSPFDITHNLTIVGKLRVIQFLSTGLTYRYATGRPFTPIAGANRNDEFGYYQPIEGPVNSERLPAFQRLDASLSYYLPYGAGHSATFYLAVSNVLNRANVLGYEYSADYVTRTPRTTNYRRFIYFGVTATLLQ
ncbi:MAG: TonB-dependent receptor [bacterium]